MIVHLPKVLIFGQPFNDFSGGGITLTNLFNGWASECLAVISYPYMLHNSSTKLCKNYYQIGMEELTWKFPFSIIKQKFSSGKLSPGDRSCLPVLNQTSTLRHSLSSGILNPFIRWTGLIHSISSIHLSPGLLKWLSDFSPEVLYLQISNRESIKFAIELIDHLRIPSVIHMMDDWPTTISSRGLFKKYWGRKIDEDFRELLKKTDVHLSISDAMSEEYLERYGIIFKAFHNPIDPGQYKSELPKYKSQDSILKILYIGRIGTANKRSLQRFATFVSAFNTPKLYVGLDIYTKDSESSCALKIGNMKGVSVRGAIEHKMIPSLLRSYDLLLLPLDFTEQGLKFSRFSMPTKASEYMMSGTPILVFAPSETAISRFCQKYDCGYCVNTTDFRTFTESIDLLAQNDDLRRRLSYNASQVAQQFFDVHAVRKRFEETISGILNP